MGPSDKAFNQVRSILGKLDRNIDSLRAQRTTPAPAPAPAGPASAFTVSPDTLIGVPANQRAQAQEPTQSTAQRPASKWGRAQPLPPQN